MTILTAIILIFMGFVVGALVLSLCSVNRVHDLAKCLKDEAGVEIKGWY